MTPKEALLVLNAVPGLGGAGIGKLISVFGSPLQVFNQSREALLEIGFHQNVVTNILHFPKEKFLEQELTLLQKSKVDILTVLDEAYPDLLRSIPQAPAILYIKGDGKILNTSSVAMVGSRKASYYGLKIAHDFASDFAKAGITVVSGMALGIDTASHNGALKAKGKTVAILGCGLNHIYPPKNKELFNAIVQQGVVVSEYPMGTPPIDHNFPMRNRIISGLSLCTVVVEAAVKSGALITADDALRQDREVFAVPGNVDSFSSGGTNQLIREGARVATSAQGVLEELGFSLQAELEHEKKEKIHVSLSVEEYKIYELIEAQPCHIDVLSTKSNQDIGVLMGQMINLEIKGVIKQLPGQYYVRV